MRFWPAAVRESPIPPGGKNPSPGRSDAFREPFPASTRQSLPMVASPGPVAVRGGEWLQYRARVVVIYVFTAPVRRFGRHQALRDDIGESGGGARRSKDGLSTGYQAFPTLPHTHRYPPRRLNDEPMPHTDAVTELPRSSVSRQARCLRGAGRGRRSTRSVQGTP